MVGKPITPFDVVMREKRRKDLNRELGTYDKKMTLIMGAKCKDGVVLIADRKITEGSQVSSQEKIILLPQMGIVFSGAGLTDLFDKFVKRVNLHIEDRKKQIADALAEEAPNKSYDASTIIPYDNPEQFLIDCETILKQLSDNYRDVIQKYQQGVSVLISFRGEKKAELHFMDTSDALDSHRKTFAAIGTGSPYAQTFLKELWHKDITMKEMARLGHFIINYIERTELDSYVGKGIQIYFVPNLDDVFFVLNDKNSRSEKLTEEETKKFETYKVKECDEKLFADMSNASEIEFFRKCIKDLAKKLNMEIKQ